MAASVAASVAAWRRKTRRAYCRRRQRLCGFAMPDDTWVRVRVRVRVRLRAANDSVAPPCRTTQVRALRTLSAEAARITWVGVEGGGKGGVRAKARAHVRYRV